MLYPYYNINDALTYVSYANLIPILTIIFTAVVFNKAGESWWKSLIPFYDKYILCKISKCEDLFIKYIISTLIVWGGLIGMIFYVMTTLFVPYAYSAVTLSASILAFVAILLIVAIYKIIIDYKVAKHLSAAFGENTAFCVGLFLFPAIFLGILALDDKKQYIYK